jgi:amino-acid N-acetyltransferase
MGVDEPSAPGDGLNTVRVEMTDAAQTFPSGNGREPLEPATSQLVVEPARVDDVADIHALITVFADRDEMLHRPLNEIYENLRNFYVVRVGGEFAGCAALHIWWHDIAEVQSVAVREDSQLKGLGYRLVSACLDEARQLGIARVFALTYKPGFFERLGFSVANVAEFPRKVWNQCYRCPKFPSCNEIAVSIDLDIPAPSTSR